LGEFFLSKKPSEPIFHDLKIFLVEDEDATAWSVETELRALGAEVKRANCIKQAFELFPNFHADIAISDLNLPDG
jgi:DNA-binding response OmpR family regulator